MSDGPRGASRQQPRWGMAMVSNASMEPTLYAGDRLLLDYRRTPVPGDVVVARLPDGTVAVKRAHLRLDEGWWLLSDNAAVGIDSRHHGAIDDVVAVVAVRLWPHPGRLRRGDFRPA